VCRRAVAKTSDDETRDIISALFAAAAANLEGAHEASVQGQAQRETRKNIERNAERLRVAARQAITLVDAAQILAGAVGSSFRHDTKRKPARD
jgi:hypothetical protein